MKDNLRKNILQLFKSGERKTSSTAKYRSEVKSLKSGLHLFSRMYIACQATSGDINTFLEHENHYWPLSLAENNLMRLKCLETLTLRLEVAPTVEVKIMMGCSCSYLSSKECDNKFRNIFRDILITMIMCLFNI